MQLSVASRWNEHSHSVSFTLHPGSLVDGRRVVGSVGRDGCYPLVDLFDPGRRADVAYAAISHQAPTLPHERGDRGRRHRLQETNRIGAYDKETGEELWRMDLWGQFHAAPITYLLDGKQYIVLAIGGSGEPERLVALALR